MTGFETGFPAQPRQTALTRRIAELRERSDAAQSEAVTGRPADPATARGGRIGEIIMIRGRIDALTQHGENVALAEARTDAMAATLAALRGIAVRHANDAATAMASGLAQGREVVGAAAGDALGRAVAALNLSLGGRALFSGDATDRPAVADASDFLAAGASAIAGAPTGALAYDALTVAFTDPGGDFETSLYTGGDGDAPGAAIAPGEAVRTDLSARDPAIRDALKNLVALTQAFDSASGLDAAERDALANRAIAGLRTAADELSGAEGQLGAMQERIAVVKSRNTAEEAALSLAYNELTGGDPYRAALELETAERQLETLFATTARLAGLSLANYLR